MLALELSWNILDSGALYRTLTFLIDKKEIDINDFIHKKDEFLKDFEVSFQVGSLGEPVSVFLKEEDITDLVRTEKIAEKKINCVKGPLFHRSDIGTNEIIQKRIKHMEDIR